MGGDGRYFNLEAAQIILKIAAANGVRKVLVGRGAIAATPAMSAIIRRRGLFGGLIMSASHNPGGKDADWGIKFNYHSGEPAPEKITDRIFAETKAISEIKRAELPDVDLGALGTREFALEGAAEPFAVEVIDPTEDYFALFREVFDFDALRAFVSRPDFHMVFDALHAVTGAYAGPLLVDLLGASPSALLDATPLPDFGGGHPDPNLTYARDLVARMFATDGSAPDFGAASDGDGDRNMVLGRGFFVTPSDSVAVLAANAAECIPYFRDGLKGVARSMPTSGALDRVAEARGLRFFETPTGWKFFGNLMDAGLCSICGEESFGTGADHVREKDGLWAVLAWLSVLARRNRDVPVGQPLVSVADVVREHWATYGRNFYSRYDYEGVDADAANALMDALRAKTGAAAPGEPLDASAPAYRVAVADDFSYTDPVDGSVAEHQGIRFVFQDNSRIVFRLSGTGSAGATVRMYVERYSNDAATFDQDAQEALKPIIDLALKVSDLQTIIGRDKPTVIT